MTYKHFYKKPQNVFYDPHILETFVVKDWKYVHISIFWGGKVLQRIVKRICDCDFCQKIETLANYAKL